MLSSRRRTERRTLLLVALALGLAVTGASIGVPESAVAAGNPPTVTGLSPTSGGSGTAISIAGTGFDGTSTVQVGTVAATDVVEKSSTLLQATVPSGPGGTVDVTVTTPADGTSATSTADRFTYIAAPKALTWTPQYNADLNSGHPQAVSCPSAGYCLAGDEYGDSITYAGHWKNPVRAVRGSLSNIDCTSSIHCLALDNGEVTVFDGHTWSTPKHAVGDVTLNALDCSSTTHCIGVAYGDGWYRYDGHSWSTIQKVKPSSQTSLRSVSCPTSSFCLAVGYGGVFQTLRSGTLGAVAKIGSATLPSVSCLPSHSCVALVAPTHSQTLQARHFDGTHWHSAVGLGVTAVLTGQVSCPTSSFCAIGGGKYGITTAGPGLTHVHHTKLAPAAMVATSCATATSCTTFDQTGRAYRWNGHVWSNGHDADPTRGGIQDLACWTVSDCMAVDFHGYAVQRNSSTWTHTLIDPGGELTRVGCSVAGTCAATDEGGHVFVREDAHWTAGFPRFAAGYVAHDVACASESVCVAVGTDGTATEWNGAQWSTAKSIGNGTEIDSVSCAPDGSCAAIQNDASGNSYFLRRTGPGQWSSEQLTIANGDEAEDVDCTSATACVVQLALPSGDTGGVGVLYLTGTLWSPTENFGTDQTDQTAGGLSCPNVLFCATFDASEFAQDVDVFDAAGNAHSYPALTVNEDVHLSGFSCPAVNNCLVANNEGVSRGM